MDNSTSKLPRVKVQREFWFLPLLFRKSDFPYAKHQGNFGFF
jgi:hypothetical protein